MQDEKLDLILAKLSTIDARISTLEARVQTIDARLASLDHNMQRVLICVDHENVDVLKELKNGQQAHAAV